MFFILGLAIFLFGAFSAIGYLEGSMMFFVDPASLFIIILPLVGILTATQSFKVFAGGLKAAIFPDKPVSEDLRGKAASLFRFLSKTTALVMVIMTLIGLLLILYNIDFADPNMVTMIGSNIAIMLVLPVYGIILIAGVFEPVVFILKKRYDKERK